MPLVAGDGTGGPAEPLPEDLRWIRARGTKGHRGEKETGGGNAVSSAAAASSLFPMLALALVQLAYFGVPLRDSAGWT